MHKLVDDVTLTEILTNNIPSAMKELTDELIKWSKCNKTKEMIIGKAKSNNIPYLQIDGWIIQCNR